MPSTLGIATLWTGVCTSCIITAMTLLSFVPPIIVCMEARSCGNTVSISRAWKWSMNPWPEHCHAWWIIFEHIGLFPNLAQHCQARPIRDWHCWWLVVNMLSLISRPNRVQTLPNAITSINWIIVWPQITEQCDLHCYLHKNATCFYC